MFNLIRMNLYRMFHTGSTWILMAVICGFSLFSAYMAVQDQELMREELENRTAAEEVQEEESGQMFGIYLQVPFYENGREPAFLEYICSDLQSGILLIFLSVFTVIFINGESKSGFAKNIAGQISNRFTLYLSKIAAVMVFVFMAMLGDILMQFTGFLIWHHGAPFGMDILGKVLRYIVIQFMLLSAFASGLALITTLIKSTAVSTTFALLVSCGFGQIFMGFFYKLFGDISIKPEKYFITNNVKSIVYDSSTELLGRAAVIAVVFLVIYNVLGSIWVQRRDVV